MSADIVSLAQAREERTPHLNGPVQCVGCGRKWVAAAPVGTVDGLECPGCHLPKGVFTNLVLRGSQTFVCDCGAEYFRISREHGPYCTNCGVVAEGWL